MYILKGKSTAQSSLSEKIPTSCQIDEFLKSLGQLIGTYFLWREETQEKLVRQDFKLALDSRGARAEKKIGREIDIIYYMYTTNIPGF